jgi:hypothetical protein
VTTITDLSDVPTWAHPGRDVVIYHRGGQWTERAHVERATRTQLVVLVAGADQRYSRGKLTRIHPKYGGLLRPLNDPGYQAHLRVRRISTALLAAHDLAQNWIRDGGISGRLELEDALARLGELSSIAADAYRDLAELDAAQPAPSE